MNSMTGFELLSEYFNEKVGMPFGKLVEIKYAFLEDEKVFSGVVYGNLSKVNKDVIEGQFFESELNVFSENKTSFKSLSSSSCALKTVSIVTNAKVSIIEEEIIVEKDIIFKNINVLNDMNRLLKEEKIIQRKLGEKNRGK